MQLDIRFAGKEDLKFIDHLQKKNAEELSFYPKVVFERELENKRILLALVNNAHAGYLYYGSIAFDKTVKIHQACIEYDLRGNWYGAGLCGYLENLAIASGAKAISLRCGSDIAANLFWKNMGFDCVSITEGGIGRMRDINTWQKLIGSDLFGFNPVEPSKKKKSSAAWRKRPKGIKNSVFARGKSLLEYRRLMLENQEDQ